MQSHSLCRTIVEMVNRSAQKTNSGRNKKDVKKTDSRKLTLEALESRELLSVSPWLSDDLSSVQTQQSSEPVAPISLSDANLDLDEPLILAAAESASTRVTSLQDVVNANDGVTTLREALANAKDGDTITFASSLKGGTIRLRGTQITIEKSVTIDASSLYDSSNNKPGLAIDAIEDSRIFEITAPSTTIKGLEFVNGKSTGNGGAVCVSANSFTSLTISQSSFHDNFASGSGGALYVKGVGNGRDSVAIVNSSFYGNKSESTGGAAFLGYATTASVSGSQFYENESTGNGGAIRHSYGTLTVNSSSLYNNTVSGNNYGGAVYAQTVTIKASRIYGNSAYTGGGIHCTGLNVENSKLYNNTARNDSGGGVYSNSATIVNSEFYGNVCKNYGGAVDVGALTVQNSSFYQNSAAKGGAVYSNGNMTSTDSSFYSNTATQDGGAVYYAVSDKKLDIDRSRFFKNTAAQNGGAIYTHFSWKDSTHTIKNSLFYQNTASYGSALRVRGDYSYLDLHNVTISNNKSTESSGALYVDSSSSSTPNWSRIRVYNSILAGNTGGDVATHANSQATINAYSVLTGYKNWSNKGTAYGITYPYSSSDPLFTNRSQGDFTLVSNSVAIDKGDSVYVDTTKDLAGNTRVVGVAVDLGAYEYSGTSLGTPTITSSSKTSNSVTIKWSSVANATGYVVEYKESTASSWTVMSKTTATTKTISNLTPDTTYKFRVKAVGSGSGDYSPYSAIKAVKTSASATVYVSSYDASTHRAIVSWTPISGAVAYKVQFSKNNGETWPNYRTGVGTTSIEAEGLYAGKTYGFRVYGVASNGTVLSDFYEAFYTPGSSANAVLDEAFVDFFEEEFFEMF